MAPMATFRCLICRQHPQVLAVDAVAMCGFPLKVTTRSKVGEGRQADVTARVPVATPPAVLAIDGGEECVGIGAKSMSPLNSEDASWDVLDW